MNSRSKASDTVFLLAFTMTFYCLGASFVESFVNYRTWGLIGSDEFRAYHQALSPLIIRTMVVPIAIKSVLVILLLWFRPTFIPRWAIFVAATVEVLGWVSTLTIQIPIQMHLSESGVSQALLDKLILTDWIRKALSIANALLFFWFITRLVRNRSDNGST